MTPEEIKRIKKFVFRRKCAYAVWMNAHSEGITYKNQKEFRKFVKSYVNTVHTCEDL